MSTAHVIRDSFNAGELSPLLSSRFAVEKLASGCRRLRNFIPHVHGPAFRRPGMEYLGPGNGDGAKSTLRTFTFSTTTGRVLEFHPAGLRVWSDAGLVPMKAEVELPYSATECAELQIAGINDTLYIAHPNHAPRVLTRRLDRSQEESWQIEELKFDWPALGDENVREDEVASPEATEELTVPTERWPEIPTTPGVHKFSVVDPDLGPSLKVARLQRRGVTAWADAHVFSWHDDPPETWEHTYATDSIFRLVYTGVRTPEDTGKLRLEHPGGMSELTTDVIRPAIDESRTVPAGEWQALVTAPASIPAGAAINVHKKVGGTWRNIKKLTITPGATTVYRGPKFAVDTEVRFDWNCDRSMPGGTARIESLIFPPSETVTLQCSGTNGTGRTLTAKRESEAGEEEVPLFQEGHIGSYWQITHRRDAAHVHIVGAVGALPSAPTAALRVSGKWDVFTYGTWNGTLYLEKNIRGVWEVLRSWESNEDRNVIASGDAGNDVELRLRVTGTGTAAGGAPVPRFVLEAADARVSGIVKITAIGTLNDEGKAKTATVDVIRPLHAATSTSLWTEGAWSIVNGFPRAVAIHAQRLWFGGTAREPQRIWGSGASDFLNFRRASFDDASVSFSPAAQPGNAIQWMLGHEKELIVGTAGNEFTLSSEGPIVTPVDVLIEPRSGYGSEYQPPAMPGDGVAFVQRGGRKLRMVAPRADGIAWSATDLTVLAEHIAREGIAQTAVMTHPFTILWAVTRAGRLLGMTFESAQNVIAWHVHETDGLVESVAVLTNVDADQVWLAVNRGGKRGIERLDPLVFMQDFATPERLIYLDAAKPFEFADATTLCPGLEHLDGRSVAVLADGAELGMRVVNGGALTLEVAARHVIVGLPFISELQPMRVDLPLPDGTAQHRNWRLSRVGLYLHESLGGEVADGPGGRFEQLQYRRAATAMDSPPPLHSGEIETPVESRTRGGADAIVRTSAPLPFNVGSITMKFDVYGD